MRSQATRVVTPVYDAYWRFAAERHAIYLRRLSNPTGPWTDDAILSRYRFTNAYRAIDRISQFLIREVQYREDRSQAPAEVFFRTILFKLFNRIGTWRLVEDQLGPVSWQSADAERLTAVLDAAKAAGSRLYSAAYIMPSPAFGHRYKHANHLALLWRMMNDGLPGRIARADSLEQVYRMLLDYPGLGPFLAFQYAIDLNYSTLTDFPEAEFVVAGPGALDGIAKCFGRQAISEARAIIDLMAESQDDEFARLGLTFNGLFGRKLQPIDCQNLFCEISKYARIAYPHAIGVATRTRIKQGYDPAARASLPLPFLPPNWHDVTLPTRSVMDATVEPGQGELF